MLFCHTLTMFPKAGGWLLGIGLVYLAEMLELICWGGNGANYHDGSPPVTQHSPIISAREFSCRQLFLLCAILTEVGGSP